MKNDQANIDYITLIIPLIALICVGYFGYIMIDLVEQQRDFLNYHEIDRIDKADILSLKDGSTIRGSFVLGSGYVNGIDVYIYYTMNDKGGYVRNRIPADVTTIYMDENDHPYLISHYVETNNRHVQYIHSYSLHVPNGTVTQTFSV
jgi:hypothetical protein